MKLQGIIGQGTGKLGNVVMAVVHGTQLVRQYQPVVANPNSEAQVQNRAKLKLLSQLSAAVSPVLAIGREGMKSARNRFVSANYDSTYFANGNAQIDTADMQLTDSQNPLSGFTADRSSGTAIHVELNDDMSLSLAKVVYIIFGKEANVPIVKKTAVCTEKGENGTFPCDLPMVSGDITVHAYGISEKTANATAKLGNMAVANAQSIAKLIATREITKADVALTVTRGLAMSSADTTAETQGVQQGTISVQKQMGDGTSAPDAGTVSGAGRYPNGTAITLTASANTGFTFAGWKEQGGVSFISTAASLNIVVDGAKTYIAVFNEVEALRVIVSKANGADGVTSVTGGGVKEEGDSVTVSAVLVADATEFGWYEDANHAGSPVSTSNPYTFTMGNATRTLYAYAKSPGDGIE